MLKSVRLNRRRTISLPASIFRPADRVAVVTEGNTVIIKKMTPSKLAEISTRAPGRPLPMKEVIREIRQYRKEKRK